MDKGPKIDMALVEEIVSAAHHDLDRVQEIVSQTPTIVNAAWDWGGGDWETPLGPAAHMGRRDIAEYLLESGARVDVFAAAMLGWVEFVRTALAASPSVATARGPHGIPLIKHALAGGEPSKQVVDLLQAGPQRET